MLKTTPTSFYSSEFGVGITENGKQNSPHLGDSSSLLSTLPSTLSTGQGETIVALVLHVMPELWEL
jgi:hypothetical protein